MNGSGVTIHSTPAGGAGDGGGAGAGPDGCGQVYWMVPAQASVLVAAAPTGDPHQDRLLFDAATKEFRRATDPGERAMSA